MHISMQYTTEHEWVSLLYRGAAEFDTLMDRRYVVDTNVQTAFSCPISWSRDAYTFKRQSLVWNLQQNIIKNVC